MKLMLDHTQRLNLHALLGAQRADVGSIRAIWALQDKLALTAEEERAISLQRETVNGVERKVWDPSASIAPKQFEFNDAEIGRIKAAVGTWDQYVAAVDRHWLQPLIDNLFADPR